MHEPLNLERLKAEVSDDDARVDLKGVVALNLNLEHEKPPMCAFPAIIFWFLRDRMASPWERRVLASLLWVSSVRGCFSFGLWPWLPPWLAENS